MNEIELQSGAIREIENATAADGPAERRVVHCQAETEWVRRLMRNVSDHTLHVLGRGPDIIVFFDQAGNEIGWRDDGRKGTRQPRAVAMEAFRDSIILELGLPPETELAVVNSCELPPLGWTHQAVLRVPGEEPLRVWADPESLRIIQCLYSPVGREETRHDR